jgi:dihydroxyacetone kinase
MTDDNGALNSTRFESMLLFACERMSEARAELCALDAAAGDGDLGATLATGFDAIRERVRELDRPRPAELLKEAGMQLARKAPSTIGALLGSAHLRAAQDLADEDSMGPEQIGTFLRSSATAVAERGKAAPGERTVLDSMGPAATAAEEGHRAGLTTIETLERAAAAAHEGATATARMQARHGRAGWIGERAEGSPDAGATAWAIYLTALAEGAALENAGINATEGSTQ